MNIDMSGWLKSIQPYRRAETMEEKRERRKRCVKETLAVTPLVLGFFVYTCITRDISDPTRKILTTLLPAMFAFCIAYLLWSVFKPRSITERPAGAHDLSDELARVYSIEPVDVGEWLHAMSLPADGLHDLRYIKDGVLHHGILAVENTTVTLYDRNGKPEQPATPSSLQTIAAKNEDV